MSPIEQNEVESNISQANNGFFKKGNEIQPGQSVVVKVVDVLKNTKTKYPIAGQDFCYRFMLEDGRAWDESAAGVFRPVIKLLHPDGKTLKPCSVKITKLTVKPTKGSQYTIDKA